MSPGRVPDGAGGCYTIPMGLCYDCGFRALTVAQVLPLPGDYALPLGSRRGINQHGELAVAEGPLRGEQPTADRDRSSFICGEGVREFVAGLSGHNLTAKGGNEGCWSGRLCRPDEQVPLSLFSSAQRIGSSSVIRHSLAFRSTWKRNGWNGWNAWERKRNVPLLKWNGTDEFVIRWLPGYGLERKLGCTP